MRAAAPARLAPDQVRAEGASGAPHARRSGAGCVPGGTVEPRVAAQEGGHHVEGVEAPEIFPVDLDRRHAEESLTDRFLGVFPEFRFHVIAVRVAGRRQLLAQRGETGVALGTMARLAEAIRQLRSAGSTVVIITHKLGETRAIADRATILRGGKLILGGVVPADFTDPELVDIFLAEGGASYFVRGEHFETVDNSLAVGGRSLDTPDV